MKIFLSAVTKQFRACRDALRSDLSAVGAEVVVQEDFQQHGGLLIEKLESYINSCDRVIALVGTACGWEPIPFEKYPDLPLRSYTQWEYFFAIGERLNGEISKEKPIFVYFASEKYLLDHPVTEPEDKVIRQQKFSKTIKDSGKDRNSFDSLNMLARLVLRDGFSLVNQKKYFIQNLPLVSIGLSFKGRDDSINQVDKILCGAGSSIIDTPRVVIEGLGGIGKTRLAIEYAWRKISAYSCCFFLDASSPKSLRASIANLSSARTLDLSAQFEKQEIQINSVIKWLSQNDNWLIIFDNIDSKEASVELAKLLPLLQNGHMLITSRRTDWSDDFNKLLLDPLSSKDASQYILSKTNDRRLKQHDDIQCAQKLAFTLDGLALAIEQASAYVT